MVCLASVYGKWMVMEDKSWHFEMDKGKGGRMFYLRDGCTHKEPLRMEQADYMLDMEADMVELSYPLPCDAPSNTLRLSSYLLILYETVGNRPVIAGGESWREGGSWESRGEVFLSRSEGEKANCGGSRSGSGGHR
ncbi:unnamed protein product [Microthlaspi erraticum]|uniref:Uncharacterized protein n=1 Tax=Microthlaspi erraticum TaxID=1685480 RepID=A0A6D2LQ54_9BRAS|nr:unnamed protein product [Microthlaspi erraticum]